MPISGLRKYAKYTIESYTKFTSFSSSYSKLIRTHRERGKKREKPIEMGTEIRISRHIADRSRIIKNDTKFSMTMILSVIWVKQ